jgi:autotransporter passenger strand-loop-strand repeat protein
MQDALSGGITSAAMVSGHGEQNLAAGGRAIGATLTSGGTQFVYPGSVATTTLVSSGSGEVISGGTSVATALRAGGYEGVTLGSAYSLGTALNVSGLSINTILSSGGLAFIYSGGLARNTVVGSGGTLIVLAGGSDIGTVSFGGVILSAAATHSFGAFGGFDADHVSQIMQSSFQAPARWGTTRHPANSVQPPQPIPAA